MHRARHDNEMEPVSEMAIVDTFTKLIFGDEEFSHSQSVIIEAFRVVNPDVLRDSHAEMGEYLRGLGVREMIQLVSRVLNHIAENGASQAVLPGQSAPGVGVRSSD